MTGGTLVVTRAKSLYPTIKNFFINNGFYDVHITELERDALINKISEINPRIVIIDSDFNQTATPLNVRAIHNKFHKLHIAAVAVTNYPLTASAWFVWYGAKSCLHLLADGPDEFIRGLKTISRDKEYISPIIKRIIDIFPEWPKTKEYFTKRQFECLVLLCSGLKAEDIADEMYISKRTVDRLLDMIYKNFNVNDKEELITHVWKSGLLNKSDLKACRRDNEIKWPEWAENIQLMNEKVNEIINRYQR